MGVPILGGWGGGSDNVGKIPTFYRFLFWRTSLTEKKCSGRFPKAGRLSTDMRVDDGNVEAAKGCPQKKKRLYVGIIPTLPSSQSWPFLEFVREAMIGCLATWELFPRYIVFCSGGHPLVFFFYF